MPNIRPYEPAQLLDKVVEIGGLIAPVGKYLIVGVQSNADAYNLFDDLFYVFDGHLLKQISTGTTNSGRDGLQFFDAGVLTGTAVWKTNKWYSSVFAPGIHRLSRPGGGMRALIQVNPVWIYRDNNRDQHPDEIGEPSLKPSELNMHGVDYNPYSNIIAQKIDRWSAGCQVWNKMGDYRQMINAVWHRNMPVDYALLKEF